MSFLDRRKLPSMKRFYNWFYKYYGGIEKSLSISIEEIVNAKIKQISGASQKTALEYACGSGLLSLYLAGIFRSVDGRDLSTGMINRARNRAAEAGLTVKFSEGNILEPDEPAESYDYVFVSYALHLFAPDTEKEILKKLFKIARESVVIIDHSRKWDPVASFVEWVEGSYYDRFIKIDFSRVALEIGADDFEIQDIADNTYMVFSHTKK